MLTLVIGDKNLSSWSLRPWLILRHFNVDFREIRLTLDTEQFKAQIAQYSGALKVPVLIDDGLQIWDSLAIAEYLNERVHGRAWPANPALRAHARSISSEMHSGFTALRQTWIMKAVGENPHVPLTADAMQDVARIDAIWSDCRARHASAGPWLFGEFSIADAMYAPVVLRFDHYGAAELSEPARAYSRHWLDDAHLREWIRDAELEADSG